MKNPGPIQAHVTDKNILPLPESRAASAPLRLPSSTEIVQAYHHHRQHTLPPIHTYGIIIIQGINLNSQVTYHNLLLVSSSLKKRRGDSSNLTHILY